MQTEVNNQLSSAGVLLEHVARDLGGRYQVERLLKDGEVATVWGGSDLRFDWPVAIKRLPSGSVGDSYYRELHALLRLHDESIVQLLDWVEGESGSRYMILEYCSGGSLRQELGQGLPELGDSLLQRVSELAQDVGRALSALHEAGYVHSDVKPENVLVKDNSQANSRALKLADFGLARTMSQCAAEGALQGLQGTPAYMAPERFRGDLGFGSDWYGLGVMLYEYLHGCAPFEGSNLEIARAHLQQEPELRGDLPDSWREILLLLLEKDPKWRLDHYGDLSQLLEAAQDVPLELECEALEDDEIGLFSFTEGSWASVSPIRRGEGRRPAHRVSSFCEDPQGGHWLADARGVHHKADGKEWSFCFGTSSPVHAMALVAWDDATPLLGCLGRERLEVFDLSGRRVWSQEHESVAPVLCVLSEGRFALASGYQKTVVRVWETQRWSCERYVLPGIPWGLEAAADQSLHVEAIQEGALRAFVLDLETGEQRPLAASLVVQARAYDRKGQSWSLLRNGLLRGPLESGVRRRYRLPEGQVQQLAVSDNQVALVVERDGARYMAFDRLAAITD